MNPIRCGTRPLFSFVEPGLRSSGGAPSVPPLRLRSAQGAGPFSVGAEGGGYRVGPVMGRRNGVLLLVVVTAIWGTTFPLVKTLGERSLEPAAIIAVRFGFAALVLSPWLRRLTWPKVRDGAMLGSVAFASYATQTIGLEKVTSGRAAFITGLNVIMVPLALPFLGRRLHRLVLVAAVLAVIGIALLSWDDGALRFSSGDVWILACAVAYAAYVLLLERFAPRHEVVALSAVQVLTVGLLGAGWLLAHGPTESLHTLRHAAGGTWVTLAYLGVVAVALSTLLQTRAQQLVPAPIAAIVYALEPVFGALAAFAWRGERIAPIGFVGGALVIVAMALSQRALLVEPSTTGA